MDDREKRIVSIFLDSSSWWDRVFRKVGTGEPTYVVEYLHPKYQEYGGIDQRRHQRRYRKFTHACRRLDYLILKHDVSNAFILGFEVDLDVYKRKANAAHAVCCNCGGHDCRFDDHE
jgi:hypothetical protein